MWNTLCVGLSLPVAEPPVAIRLLAHCTSQLVKDPPPSPPFPKELLTLVHRSLSGKDIIVLQKLSTVRSLVFQEANYPNGLFTSNIYLLFFVPYGLTAPLPNPLLIPEQKINGEGAVTRLPPCCVASISSEDCLPIKSFSVKEGSTWLKGLTHIPQI